MHKVPRKYNHLIYGLIQSGLTCAVAAAVSNYVFFNKSSYLSHWFKSWLISWIMILPVVLLAAPYIRKIVEFLTYKEIPSDFRDCMARETNSSMLSAEVNPGDHINSASV